MKSKLYKNLAILIFASAMVFLSNGSANAQDLYSTGYGTVYGSFSQAAIVQNNYLMAQIMSRTKGPGSGSPSSSAKTSGLSAPSGSKTVVPPAPVVRNHGVFRPDASVDTGKALADALGDTPEEKALIKQIYTTTKTGYEKEAAAKGWKNNIAAGLTFFTVTAMTVYRDAEEPGDEAVNNYFKIVNIALDETPEYATVSNRDKQGFNNMLIGFSGLLIAGYSEGKQTGDADTLATYKKLAGMLIEMVLKTDPENIRIENGQILMK